MIVPHPTRDVSVHKERQYNCTIETHISQLVFRIQRYRCAQLTTDKRTTFFFEFCLVDLNLSQGFRRGLRNEEKANVGLLASPGALIESLAQGFDRFWYADGLKIIGNWNLTRLKWKCNKRLQGPTFRLG